MTIPTSKTSERAPRVALTRGNGGFTLLELLIALGVMSLALGLTLPRMDAVKSSYFAAEDARAVAGFLRAARGDAIAYRTTVEVKVGGQSPRLLEQRRLSLRTWPSGDAVVALLDGGIQPATFDPAVVRRAELTGNVRLESDRSAIYFFANGSSSGGELVIDGPEHETVHHFLVDSGTGEVFVQEQEER